MAFFFNTVVVPYAAGKMVEWIQARRDERARPDVPDGEETWIVDRLSDWSESDVEEYVDRKVVSATAGTTLRSRVQFTHSCSQSVTVEVAGSVDLSAGAKAGIPGVVEAEVRRQLSLSAGRIVGREEVYQASETVDVEIFPGHSVHVEAVWHRRIKRGRATVFGTLSGRRATVPFEATIGLVLASVTTAPRDVPA